MKSQNKVVSNRSDLAAAGIIIVAALGYFVDIYDLILFNVVKMESLKALLPSAPDSEWKETGIFLFNMQMSGMLIGGVLWGVLGDKKGRLSVLFGSILLYSLANVANAFVTDISWYAFIRIIAGIGLAGELGAGITLVSESMSKENRGYGTMIIVVFGALGAVAAALVGSEGEGFGQQLASVLGLELANWQIAYLIGGILGLMLLALRVGTLESEMFKKTKASEVSRGNLWMLFQDRQRFLKYISCIMVGVPIWYMIGLMIANSETIFAPAIGVKEKVLNGRALMYCYLGLSAGDLLSGLLSQWLKSRKKVVVAYLIFSLALVIYYLYFSRGISAEAYYRLSFLMGLATGYWAIFVTIAAEQFGTNIRSTVANTVPNFVRGSVPLVTGIFGLLTGMGFAGTHAAMVVGLGCILAALAAVLNLRESFGQSLDFTEQ